MTGLGCQRELFDIPSDYHYLNCAYMSPLLRSSVRIGEQALRRKLRPFEIGVRDFFDPVRALKGQFAELIGTTDPERIAIIPSVSYGIANAVNNIDLRPGQNIVLTGEQFPSNVYPWKELAKASQGEVRIVPKPKAPQEWTNAILEAIDEHTSVVSMGHVHWTDGYRFNIEAIAEKVHSLGGLFVVDGTQSVGALEFPFDKVKPDALICAGYKWLLGPYSIGLAYYGPAFDGGSPIEHNWINRKDSHEFRLLVNYQDAFKPAANPYCVGENSNFSLTPILASGLGKLLEWNVGQIQNYCRELVNPIMDEWRSIGLILPGKDQLAYHLFGIQLPEGADPKVVKAALEERKVYVSFRGNAIRVSVHLYNNTADLNALTEALRTCL